MMLINPYVFGSAFIIHPITATFCCGFECESPVGGTSPHWQFLVGSSFCSYSTSTVHTPGLRSLRVNPNGTGMVNITVTTFVTPAAIMCARIYVRFASVPTTNCYLFWTGASSGRSGIMFQTSDSTLRVASDSDPTNIGSTGFSVTTGTWYRLDFYSVQNTGTNARYVFAQADGTDLGSLNFSSFNAASNFSIGAQGASAPSADIFFDDFVQSDTPADYPIGAGYVLPFVPVADGSHNVTSGNFKVGSTATDIGNTTTDSYQLIDEVPLDNNAPTTDDYITQITNATTEYVEHIFGAAPGISMPAKAPRTVEVIVAAHDVGLSGSNNMTCKLNDNGTENTIATIQPSSATIIEYARKHYALAPTGGAWTKTGAAGNFTTLKHRAGYSSDASPDIGLDCVMIEAEFEQ